MAHQIEYACETQFYQLLRIPHRLGKPNPQGVGSSFEPFQLVRAVQFSLTLRQFALRPHPRIHQLRLKARRKFY